MTPLASLWLPILLSAVFVFLMSFVLHMLIPWHRSDFATVPREAEVAAALRGFSIPPGDYMMPRPSSRDEMKSPEFAEKVRQGPRVVMTMMPGGDMAMGKYLVQWFIFVLFVSLFGAYIASRAVKPGEAGAEVIRFAAATTFAAYAVGQWPQSIWYRRSWVTTFKGTIDGLIYAFITGYTLCWLWPK